MYCIWCRIFGCTISHILHNLNSWYVFCTVLSENLYEGLPFLQNRAWSGFAEIKTKSARPRLAFVTKTMSWLDIPGKYQRWNSRFHQNALIKGQTHLTFARWRCLRRNVGLAATCSANFDWWFWTSDTQFCFPWGPGPALILGVTQVFLLNDISYKHRALARCTSVTDRLW